MASFDIYEAQHQDSSRKPKLGLLFWQNLFYCPRGNAYLKTDTVGLEMLTSGISQDVVLLQRSVAAGAGDEGSSVVDASLDDLGDE